MVSQVVRGPSPGVGRSSFCRCNGLIWATGFPQGKTPEDSVADQTRKALTCIAERLQAAGTGMSKVIEATVFLKDMATKDEMDKVWCEFFPEHFPSRATVGADLAPGDLVEMKITAALSEVTRGPSPGVGRSSFCRCDNLIWATAFPQGKTPQDSVADQTRKALTCVSERLQAAGTDISRVIEATVFLKDMATKDEMDKVWCEFFPEHFPSRATVCADLAPGDLVEMKITAALSEVTRGPSPGVGRSSFCGFNDLIWATAFPKGKTPEDSVADQTSKALTCVTERLQAAGTDMSSVIEATVFLKDMATKNEMDKVWCEFFPEHFPSRATVGADLAPGDLVEMKITAALPEAKEQKRIKLRKPRWTKVEKINPDSKGINLMLKCVSCKEVQLEGGGPSRIWEAVVGDETGIVTLQLRSEDQAKVCVAGASLRMQNAKSVMIKGHIRVAVDKWAVLKPADSPLIIFDPKTSKDVSAVEFELVG